MQFDWCMGAPDAQRIRGATLSVESCSGENLLTLTSGIIAIPMPHTRPIDMPVAP